MTLCSARPAIALAVTLATLAGALAAAPPASWQREWPDTDFTKSAVDFAEIFSGGPPKDGIPAIDDPRFVPAPQALADLAPTEPVISLAIDGDARAYPLRILIWHEIVNDTVGGTPVAVTFCPLCNSGVVFDRRVDGKATTFGTTGKLRNSDLVMYDRASESWWQQFEGRAIVGVRTGTELDRLPARHESLQSFAERHPDGRVLVPNDASLRAYGRNPYAGYDSAPAPFLYQGRYDGPGRALMRVVAIEGIDTAFSLDLVRRRGRIEHGDLLITWTAGQNSALDSDRIDKGRDIGTVTVQRRGKDGALTDIPYDLPFAFAFSAFRPDTPILHTP